MRRRERILMAVSHQEPDRVPISFDIVDPTLQQKLLNYFGAKSLNGLYEKTGIDAFSVWTWPAAKPVYCGPEREGVEIYDETYGAWGKVNEKIFPLRDKALDDYRWPKAEDFDFSTVRSQLLQIKQMDMTTAAGHAGAGWCHHVQMRGYENALYDVMDDGFMEEYMARNRAFLTEYFTALFKEADGEIDFIRADEDLGGHLNMLISPDTWRKWYKPLWKEIFDMCHENNARVWMHSCGYCRPLVDDFVEIGVDVLNPIPPYVRDSDPMDIKQTYGKKLTLDGAVDQMRVLIAGTPQDVEREVKLRLKQLAPGGGYMIGPSQVFTKDVPFENMLAFFRTALEYGDYSTIKTITTGKEGPVL